MIERVVVPGDFSAESDRALSIAPVLARWAGAGVELVAVAEPVDRAGVESRLAELAEGVGDNATWRIVESGGPAEAALLTELHRDEKALWCIGSHARGAWSELLIDSVSEDLVRDAHVPVVLVGPHVDAPPFGRVLARRSTAPRRAKSSCQLRPRWACTRDDVAVAPGCRKGPGAPSHRLHRDGLPRPRRGDDAVDEIDAHRLRRPPRRSSGA